MGTDETMDTTPVGFVGLGHMGAGMAGNLVRAGVPLTVWDVRAESTAELAELGAQVAVDPVDLARRVELVFLCVPSDLESADVLFGERGVAQARRSLTIVDTTTMNQGAAQHLSERSAAAGLAYSDCPVSGMPRRAADGTLTMMFGGSREAFAAVAPYLDIMGEFVVHCGDVGMGQLMKAVNNVIYDVNIAAFCEVMPLAVKAGLSPERLGEVLTTGSSRSFASEHFVPRILDGVFEGDFSLEAAYKDIVNIQEAAARHQATLPVVEAMVGTYRAAIDMGLGEQPKSAMVKVYEERFEQRVRRRLADPASS